jgi:hypothetical protein
MIDFYPLATASGSVNPYGRSQKKNGNEKNALGKNSET